MADEYILKHLQDVLDAINEMQSCFVDFPNGYDFRHIPELKKDIERIIAGYGGCAGFQS